MGTKELLGKIHRRLLGKYHSRSSRFMHLMKGKVRWIFPTLNFLSKNTKREKRILLIWDLQAAPYSVGDLIFLHQAAQILRLTQKIDKVDICFICNPKHPSYEIKRITPDNFYTYLPTLISTIYLNPHIGNFFIFDSNDEFEDFISKNSARYYIWPDFKEYIGKHRAHLKIFDFIQKFYINNGFIPSLDYRQNSLNWAHSFYKKNIFPKFPIVVHLRNNPNYAIKRNAKLDEWIKFFKKAKNKFKNVKFILVGAKEEIDDRIRRLSNVLIAKDYGTTAEQDLILVATSLMVMGTASGPTAAILFSKKPYIIFNFTPGNTVVPLNAKHFSFATENQILNWGAETEKRIMKEFTNLFSKINKTKWMENSKKI